MAKKKPPSPELVEEWRELSKRFYSAAAIGVIYGYPASHVSRALYPEHYKET